MIELNILIFCDIPQNALERIILVKSMQTKQWCCYLILCMNKYESRQTDSEQCTLQNAQNVCNFNFGNAFGKLIIIGLWDKEWLDKFIFCHIKSYEHTTMTYCKQWINSERGHIKRHIYIISEVPHFGYCSSSFIISLYKHSVIRPFQTFRIRRNLISISAYMQIYFVLCLVHENNFIQQ